MPSKQQDFQVVVPDYNYWKQNIKCQTGCPVNTDSRGYVLAISSGDYEKAYWIARKPNPLASICGRVCGAPCELACRRGWIDEAVSIRALKRFVTEKYGVEIHADQKLFADKLKHTLQSNSNSTGIMGIGKPTQKPITIIGAGPAGLSCAHDLALMGYHPIILEMEKIAGGMCVTGVPPYRLPRGLIQAEIDAIRALGVEIKLGVQVGKDISLNKIHETSEAVLLAVGARNGRILPVDGVNHKGVSGGVEFLRDVFTGKDVKTGPRVVVIGGGNVAYDVARTSIRMPGVESVSLVCVEGEGQMLADKIEIEEGAEEGVDRFNSFGPHKINATQSGDCQSVTFKKVISVFDSEGKFNPRYDESDLLTMPADTIFFAIGQSFDLSFLSQDAPKIDLTERGMIRVKPDKVSTSLPGFFVAGDLAYGPKLIIDAVASGQKAALAIHEHISGRRMKLNTKELHHELPNNDVNLYKDWEKISRCHVPVATAEVRRRTLTTQVETGFKEGTAKFQGGRCLECAVNTIFDGSRCIMCGGCADVCPEYCLRLVSMAQVRKSELMTKLFQTQYQTDPTEPAGPNDNDSLIIKDEERCIRCALCAKRCPVDAITMEKFSFKEVWANG